MGVVEDVRAALQDFVAPELRELAVRIQKLEAEQKDFRSEAKNEFRELRQDFKELDRKMDRHYESLLTEVRRTATLHDLAERVARLEAERRAS